MGKMENGRRVVDLKFPLRCKIEEARTGLSSRFPVLVTMLSGRPKLRSVVPKIHPTSLC